LLRERGLGAHPRHDDGAAAVEDALGELSTKRCVALLPAQTHRRLQVQPPAVVIKQLDRASSGAVIALEQLQDAMERRFHVDRAGQRLAHVEQGRKFTDLPAVPEAPFLSVGGRGSRGAYFVFRRVQSRGHRCTWLP
jgi:hypothetical protein